MSSPSILCIIFISLALISISPAISQNIPTVYEILQENDFPVGILPKGVTSYKLDRSTGKFTVYFDQTCTYTIDGYELKYRTKITGVISKDKIKDLSGVQVKVLFFWLNVVKVTRYGDQLDFSVGIASAAFPVDRFFESPQCDCGFDCVNLAGIEKLSLLGHQLQPPLRTRHNPMRKIPTRKK